MITFFNLPLKGATCTSLHDSSNMISDAIGFRCKSNPIERMDSHEKLRVKVVYLKVVIVLRTFEGINSQNVIQFHPLSENL